MRRPRIYHPRSYYYDDDDYIYRGQLNEHCDVWYDTDDYEEILRCDQGFFYNYDYESPDGRFYSSSYSSFSSKPDDWDRREDFFRESNDFDEMDRKIDYDRLYRNEGLTTEDIAEGAKTLGK